MIRKSDEPGIPATITSSVFLGMTLHYFAALENGMEVEIVVPSDLSDILPDGERVSLAVVPEKINVFDRKTKKTLIPEGA